MKTSVWSEISVYSGLFTTFGTYHELLDNDAFCFFEFCFQISLIYNYTGNSL
jgi:hypothetical protein